MQQSAFSLSKDLESAILNRRSIRKFQQKEIEPAVLTKLVDLARFHASGANLQPLCYAIISRDPMRSQVFPHLKWAGYLPEFTIAPDEQPTAYIVLIHDTTVRQKAQFDVGAAATTILLASESMGIGTCCIASFTQKKISELLNLPETMVPELVIALGYPAHEATTVPFEGSVKYYQDETGKFYVPKRNLEDVLLYSDAKE